MAIAPPTNLSTRSIIHNISAPFTSPPSPAPQCLEQTHRALDLHQSSDLAVPLATAYIGQLASTTQSGALTSAGKEVLRSSMMTKAFKESQTEPMQQINMQKPLGGAVLTSFVLHRCSESCALWLLAGDDSLVMSAATCLAPAVRSLEVGRSAVRE